MEKSLNKSCSFISKESSTWIKGLLIFLIVLGHNMVFTYATEDYGAMTYLYMFHIHGFFLLPFLYGSKPLTIERISNQVIRLYWPYFIMALPLTIVFGLYNHFQAWTPQNILSLFVLCTQSILRSMCGISILWFLPALMMSNLIKDFFYNTRKWIQIFLLFVSTVFNILSILCMFVKIPYYGVLIENCPLQIPCAMRYLLLGVTLRWIVEKLQNISAVKVIISCSALFSVATILYFTFIAPHPNKDGTPLFRILEVAVPVVVMVLLWELCNIMRPATTGVLYKLGAKSMSIYLVSPFIGYVTYFIALYFGLVNIWVSLLNQILIVGIAFIIAKYIIRGHLEKFIMPRTVDDIKIMR